jgi:GNAT superfamily N-acetyltransferase
VEEFTMADSFHIRTASPADIPALRALIEHSVRGLQQHDYTPAQIEGALGHALGLDTQLVADGTYFVATPVEDASVIAGSGGWSFRKTLFGSDGGPDRVAAALDPGTDAAKIRAIFVDPSFARRGLGSLILQHCEAAASAAGFTHVEMGSTLTGLALYRLKGYVDGERVEVPLPNGEVLPIVRMTKSL